MPLREHGCAAQMAGKVVEQVKVSGQPHWRKYMSDNILLLGEIKGKLETLTTTIDSIDGKLDRLDGRVRRLEGRSAAAGALAGTFVSVGMAILIEKIKKSVGL